MQNEVHLVKYQHGRGKSRTQCVRKEKIVTIEGSYTEVAAIVASDYAGWTISMFLPQFPKPEPKQPTAFEQGFTFAFGWPPKPKLLTSR